MFRLWAAGLIMLTGSVFAATNRTIIVSAPRLDNLDLMAVDTAADVTVIDREAIEESGAVSVPELLQTEANVLIRSTTGNVNDGQISMRGFGENSQLRTLVLVDGHKMNRPDMGGISWQSVPVSNIDRIEVIRGGQNVLYGDRAVGGVIKITTKRGSDAGNQLGGSIGSFGYISGHAGHGSSYGNVDYHIGIDAYDSDGFRSNSAARATSFYGSLVGYVGEADTLSFRIAYTDSENEFPGPLSYTNMMQDPSQSYYSGNDASEMEDTQATLIWETERDWGAARVTSGVNYRDLAWMLGGIDAENRQFGASLGPRVRWGSEQQFFMGGVDMLYDQINFKRFDSQVFSGSRAISSEADLDRVTFSPYVFAQKDLSWSWLVNGGVRYEYARTDNVNNDYNDLQLFPTRQSNRGGIVPNPAYKNPPDLVEANSYDGVVTKEGWAAELSLVHELNRDWSIWAGYDRIYRYPTLDETASYQGFLLSDPLNENLDPETGNQFEVGFEGGSGMWGFSSTAFYLMMDNEIVFTERYIDPTTVIRLNTNLGQTRRYGLESELSIDRTWYGASTRWVFQDARLVSGEFDGNRVPLVPWNYGIFSTWIKPHANLVFTLSYAYVSDQYVGNNVENETDPGSVIDAYGLLGFRANIAMSEQARIEVVMDNLLDTTYASTAYPGGYYPGAGRSFRVGLTLEF